LVFEARVRYRRKNFTFAISSPDEFLFCLPTTFVVQVEQSVPCLGVCVWPITFERKSVRLSRHPSICPSVCLSVCHKLTLDQKWIKAESHKQRRTIVQKS